MGQQEQRQPVLPAIGPAKPRAWPADRATAATQQGGAAATADTAAGVSVVSRTVALLRSFAEASSSVSIKDLSAELGLPPSTLHRLLDQLLAAGMIERAPRHRYRVSAEFSRIGGLAARKTGVLQLARPVIEDVARETAETCMLGMLLPQKLMMMFIDKVPSSLPVPYRIRMRETRSLLWGATGLCMLAWLGRAEVEHILGRGELSPVDGQAPPDRARLADRLARIRAQGYAMTRGEETRGAVGMAAPVFGASRQIVADLCITVPQARFAAEHEARFAGLLMRRATHLSRMMGGPGMPDASTIARA